VAFVTLDPATGRLAQPAGTGGCYTFDGSSADGAGTCADINASSGGFRLALSPDELFAYLPSDGGTGGSITAFSRQVPPTCTNVAGTTPFQTAFGLTLACSDPNGDAITREIVAQPAHGTLGVLDQASGGVSFAPANGFSGFDSFSFRATDSASLSSAPATASVTVGAAPPTPPTPAPTALDKTAPGCTRSGGKTLSLRTLTVTLRCNEAATVSLKLTLPAAVAKKLKIAKVVAIATGKASLRADVSAKIKLKLTKKAKKRLGKLRAAKLKKLRPTLTYTASDAAGNRAAKSVKLKLKR